MISRVRGFAVIVKKRIARTNSMTGTAIKEAKISRNVFIDPVRAGFSNHERIVKTVDGEILARKYIRS